jgi:uncharacterized repeat protein (TIGR01451 family)
MRRFTLSLLALALALPGMASASTAANTVITNRVSVTYNDESGAAQAPVTAQASVTVTLVAATPLLDPASNVTVAQSQAVALTYTLTANANGPDDYRVTAVPAMSQMQAAAVLTLPPDIRLGGTTLAADAISGTNTILVPYDNVNDNSSINDLAPGDTIMVGGNPYVIDANGIVKDALANTATIRLETNLTGPNVLAGAVVGERVTFDITFDSGLIAATHASGTHSVTATVRSMDDASKTVTQGTATVVTVTRPMLTVQKFVSTDGGESFDLTGTAPPTTLLVYKIVVTNGGASDADAVVINDTLPLFLTYEGNAKLGSNAAAQYDDAGNVDLPVGGAYTVAGSNISYAAGTLGSAAGSNVLVLFYTARIQ